MSTIEYLDDEIAVVLMEPGERPSIAIIHYPEAGLWGWHLAGYPDLGGEPFDTEAAAKANADAVLARSGWVTGERVRVQ